MRAPIEEIAEVICRSETFRTTPRLRDFLRYLVKCLAIDATVKEVLIGIEFFHRDPAYDPRRDPIVRVEAHRLRRLLRKYYHSEGAQEPWQLYMPIGAYSPKLRRREEAALEWRLAVKVQASDPLIGDGIAAELTRQLGSLRGVQVLALSSNPERADANAILECRLDGINIQAKLSRRSGNQLTELGSFDNSIQPSVEALTQFVASTIGLRRTGGASPRALLDFNSYQVFLAGRAWFHRCSPGNLEQAARCFEEVIDRHPAFAPAYASLADIQVLMAYWFAPQARPVLERGLIYAAKAAELDPVGADVLCSRAALEAVLHYRWEEAEANFRRALESNPNNSLALNWLAIVGLVPQLRFSEAVDAVFAAYDLDPASPEIGNEVVWVRICCEQYAESADQARRIVELHPDFLEVYWSLSVAESSCGRHADSLAALDRAERIAPGVPMTCALRCFAEAASGNRDAAYQSLQRLESLSDPSAARSIFLAWAHAAVGNLENAMHHLEKAVDAADPQALYLEVFPPSAPLRTHPRYPEILRRQRLPSRSTATK